MNCLVQALHFNQSGNRIYLNEQDLLNPMPSANALIAEQNDQLVAEYLAHFEKPTYSQLVRDQLIEQLPRRDFLNRNAGPISEYLPPQSAPKTAKRGRQL